MVTVIGTMLDMLTWRAGCLTSLTTNEFMVIEKNFTLLSYADDVTLVPLTTENRPFW